jgi:DNA polymerase
VKQRVLHLDFETRSACDLKRAGLHVYARHQSTSILCAAYSFDEGPIELWFSGSPLDPRVIDHVAKGLPVWAHNVAFEREVWNQAGDKFWPRFTIEQSHCTMALAYAMALPGSLDNASAAAGISQKKDMAGWRLMMKLSRPREIRADGSIVWWEDPSDLKRLGEYCVQDVVVERELLKRLLALSPRETRIWRLDQWINRRGVQIDVRAANLAMKIVEQELDRLNKEMREVTGNKVATCSATKQLTDWLISRGLDVDGVAKADVLELLDQDIPEDCRRALLLRQEAAKSSTAKLSMMLDGVGEDGRIRGIFQYCGAGTGRWAGRRIQPQNFPRPKLSQSEIDNVFEILEGVK